MQLLSTTVGRFFYGGGRGGGGGGGLSKNVGHHVWPTTKSKKKTLAKTPQSTPPKNEIWTKT